MRKKRLAPLLLLVLLGVCDYSSAFGQTFERRLQGGGKLGPPTRLRVEEMGDEDGMILNKLRSGTGRGYCPQI